MGPVDRITAMKRGGLALAKVKQELREYTQPGITFAQIEAHATKLIAAAGMKPSFSTVPGYHWTTCVMKNDALCHGIPGKQIVEDGDIITIDVGLICDGFHLDTTISFGVGTLPKKLQRFLETGQRSLNRAIELVRAGQSVYQLSRAMEKTLLEENLGAVYQLTGHGVGEELHMEPTIPCVANPDDKFVKLTAGQTIAVEVMYTMGDPTVVVADDDWTFCTKDGSLSAMFEETVLVEPSGFQVLTKVR